MLYFSRAKDGQQEEDSAAFGGVVIVVLWFGGEGLAFGWLVSWLVGPLVLFLGSLSKASSGNNSVALRSYLYPP